MHSLAPEATHAEDRMAALARHFVMLGDRRRTLAFKRAVARTVRPGDVVADLGTGSGVLAMFAAQAGAARVYAVERDPATVELARELIARNGLDDRIEVIAGDAGHAALPEPVDVILCELIGHYGAEEAIEQVTAAATERYLKPGGRVVPQRLTTYAVPLQLRQVPEAVYRRGNYGLDLRVDGELPAERTHAAHPQLPRPRRLGPAQPVEDIVCGRPAPCDRTHAGADLPIERAGVLQAVYGFFEAELAPGVRFRDFPSYPGASWHPMPWPVVPAETVTPGMRYRLQLTRVGQHATIHLAAQVERIA